MTAGELLKALKVAIKTKAIEKDDDVIIMTQGKKGIYLRYTLLSTMVPSLIVKKSVATRIWNKNVYLAFSKLEPDIDLVCLRPSALNLKRIKKSDSSNFRTIDLSEKFKRDLG